MHHRHRSDVIGPIDQDRGVCAPLGDQLLSFDADLHQAGRSLVELPGGFIGSRILVPQHVDLLVSGRKIPQARERRNSALRRASGPAMYGELIAMAIVERLGAKSTTDPSCDVGSNSLA